MTNKRKRVRALGRHGKPSKHKYFNMEESAISTWRVSRKRKGYYLYGNELGQVGDASPTICDALNSDPQFGGDERVKIDTNVKLEELFAIMNSYAFETLMHNTSSFVINNAEIDKESLRNVVIWYNEVREKKRVVK
jgi:hypothetical protein